jgi:hypothetical protein
MAESMRPGHQHLTVTTPSKLLFLYFQPAHACTDPMDIDLQEALPADNLVEVTDILRDAGRGARHLDMFCYV